MDLEFSEIDGVNMLSSSSARDPPAPMLPTAVAGREPTVLGLPVVDSVSSVSGTAKEEDCRFEGPGPDLVDRIERAQLSGGALGERPTSGNDGNGLVGAGKGNALRVPMDREVRRDFDWFVESGSSAVVSDGGWEEVALGSRAPAHCGSDALVGPSVKTSDDFRGASESTEVVADFTCGAGVGVEIEVVRLLTI